MAALHGLLAAGNRFTTAVSHGQLITHILGYIDPSFGFEGWQAITTPDVFLIEARRLSSLRFERVWKPLPENEVAV